MKITGVQFDISWENKKVNLNKLNSLIEQQVDQDTDLLILPEMFTTGFSMNPVPFSESMDGSTVNWMQEKAKQLSSAVCGSLMVNDGEEYRNRFIFVDPDKEEIDYYDKGHPFCLNNEGDYFKAGKIRKTIKYQGWKIFPTICYDLRFPVWNRNDLDYDILINVANWPSVRSFSWNQFLSSRAMENQAYVIGINRVGTDIHGMPFSGNSAILSYDGKAIIKAAEYKEQIITAELSKEKLIEYRKNYPFLRDRDHFTII